MKIIIVLSLFVNLAFCQIVVITSSKNKLIKITKRELIDIYLKKKIKIKGITLIPINNHQNYTEFCKKILRKTPKQMRAYWAKELYNGSKIPPKIKNNTQIKNAIKKDKRVISYASNKLTGKIILQISK